MENMAEEFKTVFQGAVNEIVIKKSRFIATVSPAGSEEEALEIIETLKKKYWDASHNCYAYIIGTKNPLMRCSDDGEPSKTAGKPMLDILTSHELYNLVVVVTRYFGGTLLGTGGLVKAYQSAVLEGLNRSIIIKKELGRQLILTTDYNYIGKLQYYMGQEAIPALSSDFTDIVKLVIIVPSGIADGFVKKVSELTNGSAAIEEKEQVYFTRFGNEIHLL